MAEKPLTADRKTGEQIAEAVERHNVIAGVAYQWRAMDTIPVVREQLEKTPPRMIVGTYHGPTPPPAWWRRQEQSGGQFVEQATHLFDLARYLVGKDVTVKCALGHYHDRPKYPGLNVADVSTALLQFGDDIPSVFNATCLLNRPTTLELQLICDGVRITVSKFHTIFEDGYEFRKLEVKNNPYLTEDQAFIEAVQTGDPAKLCCSYADGLLTHDLTHTILEMMSPVRMQR
jgi:predicted dehydrogenase